MGYSEMQDNIKEYRRRRDSGEAAREAEIARKNYKENMKRWEETAKEHPHSSEHYDDKPIDPDTGL